MSMFEGLLEMLVLVLTNPSTPEAMALPSAIKPAAVLSLSHFDSSRTNK
jgi:hypothetical protein